MKKAVSLVLAAVLFVVLCVPAAAASCDHDYISEHFEADCLSAEHTVFTCRNCGDTYVKYAYEYDDPGVFAFAFESDRNDEEGTVTLTAKLLNNPGLSIAIMEVDYNSELLCPQSFTNGVVWSSSELNLGRDIDLNRKPLKIYAERTSDEINYTNGVYFTVVFSVNPDVSFTDCGFAFTLRGNDFLNAVTGERFTPKVIDVTDKKNLGGHSLEETVVQPGCTEGGYTLHTCAKCGYSVTDEQTLPVGHLVEESIIVREPTFTEEGLSVGKCTRCGAEIESSVPVLERWKKGDLNNDTKINAIDSNIQKRIITGSAGSSSVQMRDAADINGDGKVNAADSNLIKRLITGSLKSAPTAD